MARTPEENRRDRERRAAFAREQGYESYDQYRNAIADVREQFADHGIELDIDEARAAIHYDDSGFSDRDPESWKADYEELFGIPWDEDEDAYWDWVRTHYEKTAG